MSPCVTTCWSIQAFLSALGKHPSLGGVPGTEPHRMGRAALPWVPLLLAAGRSSVNAQGPLQQALIKDCISGCEFDAADQAAHLLQVSAVAHDATVSAPANQVLLLDRGDRSSSSSSREASAERNWIGSLSFVSEDPGHFFELPGGEVAFTKSTEPEGLSISDEFRKVTVSVVAVALGALLVLCGRELVGLIAIYFGAQSGMSLYMKLLFSDTVIAKELDLIGIPAPFLVTGAQQVVAFFIIAPLAVTSVHWSADGEGAPGRKLLKMPQGREWVAIVLFSLFFAANIGMNNASLSMVPLSLNLIIRSCLPIVTLVTTRAVSRFVDLGDQGNDVTPLEVCLMGIGVLCAGVASLASSKGSAESGGGDSSAYAWGILVCFLSTIAGALNLIVTRFLGSGMKMNPLEATTYTSLPCACFLLIPSLCMPHPTAWPGYSSATDWEIFRKVLEVSPSTLGWILVSGSFAAGYNLLQYLMVNYLTATHTAFCGNFNKAATIALSLATGMEALPGGVWSFWMAAAIVGNLMSFSAYSLLKVAAPAK